MCIIGKEEEEEEEDIRNQVAKLSKIELKL